MTEHDTMRAYQAVVEEHITAIRDELPPEARASFDEGRELFAELREHHLREEQRLADMVSARADHYRAITENVMRVAALDSPGNDETAPGTST